MHYSREEHVSLLKLLVDDQPLIVLRDTAEDVTLVNSCLLDAFYGTLVARETHVTIKADDSSYIVYVRPCLLALVAITF
jgi:hypothetical protein